MQINRLFEIVYLLVHHKKMTARQLADHFEVSVRTIRRDIDILSGAGIPLYTIKGRQGGIGLLDNYVLSKAAFSEGEQQEILLALQSRADFRESSASALVKLGAIFQKDPADWLEVDFSRWGQSQQDSHRFETLKQAVLGRRAIQFAYVGANGEHTHRKAIPLRLVYKSQSWYLQGFCLTRQDYRTFKIHRMLGIEVVGPSYLEQDFTPPPLESQGPAAPLVDLQLVFAKHCAYRLYDNFDENCILQNDDGSYFVSVSLPQDDWLYSFLLSFGKSMTLLSPQTVGERLQALSL